MKVKKKISVIVDFMYQIGFCIKAMAAIVKFWIKKRIWTSFLNWLCYNIQKYEPRNLSGFQLS